MISKSSFKRQLSLVAPFLLGSIIFYLVVGPSILNPSFISWIQDGDPSQQYLGWVFFRQDEWRVPPGLNPTFGMDVGASIVYSDSIPLLALLFKLLRNHIGAPFQYFGIWTYFCFVMQAVAAWKLVGLFSKQWWIKFLATALISFSLPLFWRVGFHNYLVAHFLILFSIYLSFKKNNTNLFYKWTLLLCVALLVNFYLYLMVLVLWFGSTFDRYRLKIISISTVFINLILNLFFAVFLMWIAGYFSIENSANVSTGMYGSSKLNLVSLFDANGWSKLIAILFPHMKSYAGNNYESFHFLGMGLIFLGLLAIYAAKECRGIIREKIYKNLYFLFGILLLTLFALTNQVTFADYVLNIPIPSWLYGAASSMRSSGRMFLPAYYCIVFCILSLIAIRFSNKKTIILLSMALVIQVYDSSNQWMSKRVSLENSFNSDVSDRLNSPLKNAFWTHAATKYSRLIILFDPLPKGYIPENWRTFADYASQHDMQTNATYLARFDELAAANQYWKHLDDLVTGNYMSDTLYVFDEEKILPVMLYINRNEDLLFKVDGFYILAPGLKSCQTCEILSGAPPALSFSSPHLFFGKGGNGTAYLVGVDKRQIKGWGWTYPESWGVWSEGGKAKLLMPLNGPPPKTVLIKLRAFITAKHPSQHMIILINGEIVGRYLFTSDLNEVIVNVPDKVQSRLMTIEFQLPNNVSPKSLGVGDDTREIAIGLIEMQFKK